MMISPNAASSNGVANEIPLVKSEVKFSIIYIAEVGLARTKTKTEK